MKTIIVTTQAELDILPEKFEEFTVIEIRSKDWIKVKKSRENSLVIARENSSVKALGNSSVRAYGNSSVEACGNSSVVAFDNSSVGAWGDSSVEAWGNSSVEAWGNSLVEAYGNSSVNAWGNSSVKAYENSSVEAWDNSSVEAYENSLVKAWGDSSVEAYQNSSVKAWRNSSVKAFENSSVKAYGNSSVGAWGNSSVKAWGDSSVEVNENASVDLWDNATATGSGKINVYKSNIPKNGSVKNWIASEFVKAENGFVTLYKRVSCDYKTQEGKPNETLWKPGTIVDHPDWNPGKEECGPGKFHACSRPYFCDEFRFTNGDKYVAIKIAVEDLVAWKNPDYPHKIAFRKGKVVRECGRMG